MIFYQISSQLIQDNKLWTLKEVEELVCSLRYIKLSGKIPLVSVRFIISVSGLLNTSELYLIKEFEIPYNPQLNLFFNLFITIETFVSLILFNLKLG